jgi:putative membrane protein
VAALAVAYIVAVRVSGNRVTTGQIAAFAGALAALLLTLTGPLDELEDARLFTAHMTQHLVLTLIVPPLLLLGTPGWMLRPFIKPAPLARLARIVTHPIVAFALYNALLIGIHNPPVFELMCRDENFHIAVHVLLIATGVITWWPLLSPLPELPRLSYPGQMIYLFLQLIPMAAVAAPITLADSVIYPYYATSGPHPLGMSPLSDQILGGLFMWVGAGFYMTAVFTLIFYRWAMRDDRDSPMVSDESQGPSGSGSQSRHAAVRKFNRPRLWGSSRQLPQSFFVARS